MVAAEVKNLAGQTAKATEDIAAQIAQIQAATHDTIETLRGIGATITEMSTIASEIAGAVRPAARHHYGDRAQRAARRRRHPASVGQHRGGVPGARERDRNADQMAAAVTALSGLAQRLTDRIARLLGEIRAA